MATAPVSGAALASEFDVLATPVPQDGAQYLIDDGDLLNKVSRRSLPKKLQELEKATGFHLTVSALGGWSPPPPGRERRRERRRPPRQPQRRPSAIARRRLARLPATDGRRTPSPRW